MKDIALISLIIYAISLTFFYIKKSGLLKNNEQELKKIKNELSGVRIMLKVAMRDDC